MSKSVPFPTIEGGCVCGAVRFRFLSSPLFCYACHCGDCQKRTGSVFACYTSIEADRLKSTGQVDPRIDTTVRHNGIIRHSGICPRCHIELWSRGVWSPATIDVKVGVLDMPGLMEPDIHMYIESKVRWVQLPKDAKTCTGVFDRKRDWPRSSLARWEACISRQKKAQEQLKKKELETVGSTDENADGEKELDKTPTAHTPEEREDDEEFEKRYRETEKALQERLEKLSLKLEQEQA